MKTPYLDLSDDEAGLEKIINFLKDYGIDTWYTNYYKEYHYSRTIEFKVDGQIYQILWFKNESTLKIGNNPRCGFLPFKYMFFDSTMPVIGGNKSIGFAHKKVVDWSGETFDYGTFHIPLEL